MTIDIEPWVGLLPEGDHYATIRPLFRNERYVLLCRIDCGAGSILHVEGVNYDGNNKLTLRDAALPLIHTGETKFRLRIYTGNAQMPVLDQQMTVVVPAPVLAQSKTPEDVATAEKYAGMSRQRAEEARQKYYQALSQPMPDYGNSCYDHWDNWVREMTRAEWDEPRSPWEPTWEADRWRQYAAVLDQFHAALNEVYYYKKPKENFWRKTAKSGWVSLSLKPQLLIRHGRIDQANMWLAAVEKGAGQPPGPLYEREKPYGEDMWVTYNALMMAYAKHRLDPGRAREVYNRLKAWGATEGARHVWENNKRWLERAEAYRAFFHPEAFDGTSVPVPLPGQRPEDAGVIVPTTVPARTPAPARGAVPTAVPTVTPPPGRAREPMPTQRRQSKSPAVLYREADEELNTTWQTLYAAADAKKKERLQTAQRLWIKLRDADAESIPGGPSSDKGLNWLAGSTRTRTWQLQAWRNSILGGGTDNPAESADGVRGGGRRPECGLPDHRQGSRPADKGEVGQGTANLDRVARRRLPVPLLGYELRGVSVVPCEHHQGPHSGTQGFRQGAGAVLKRLRTTMAGGDGRTGVSAG